MERSFLGFLLAFIVALYVRNRRQHAQPLPPGPSGLPLLGSVLKWPKGHAWLKFNDWTKEFGSFNIHYVAKVLVPS